MTVRLIVSLSGLTPTGPAALADAAAFTAELAARGVPVSQLFRPHGATPGSPLVAWLHERRAAGDAVVLHGFDHNPDPIGNWGTAPVATGRRAEFAMLPRHEAGLRLTAARRVLTAVGLRTDLFVPPRWLASAGTLDALAEQGFAVLADGTGVRTLCGRAAGELVRARVLGFRAADRQLAVAGTRAETLRCRALVAEVGLAVRRGGLVRLNVRAKDLRSDRRRATALVVVDTALARGAVPATYGPVAPARYPVAS